MAYKKDQGRYARILAFWSLLLLLGYGCLGELRYFLQGLIESGAGDAAAAPWIDNLPLIGAFDLAFTISAIVLVVIAAVIHGLLNRPASADLLIETEGEMRKVTWPSGGDTVSGAVAVVITVAVMLTFLTLADSALGWIMKSLLAPNL